MRTPTNTRPDGCSASRSAGFVLGRDHFARISAVEGIALTEEMRTALDGFDRDGLNAEERRRAILPPLRAGTRRAIRTRFHEPRCEDKTLGEIGRVTVQQDV